MATIVPDLNVSGDRNSNAAVLPGSAMMTYATRRLTPGMVSSRVSRS
jgi:hypothetical protein